MIIAKTHDDFKEHPHVPGPVPKRQQKGSLSDAFASAIAKVLSPTQVSSALYDLWPSTRYC